MLRPAVKWQRLNDYGNLVFWSRWHAVDGNTSWSETTLCGVSIPSEDYFTQIDFDHEGITCERCNAVIEKREKAEGAAERKALLMERIQTAVANATKDMTALRFGDFTLDECKEVVGEPDGRKVVAALRQLGYKERRSGLWYLPYT